MEKSLVCVCVCVCVCVKREFPKTSNRCNYCILEESVERTRNYKPNEDAEA